MRRRLVLSIALCSASEIHRARPAKTTELRLTLGSYYAAKIRGATPLALYHATGAPARKQEAIAHLRTVLAAAQYKPRLLNRVGFLDLNAPAAKVALGIAPADAWQWSR